MTIENPNPNEAQTPIEGDDAAATGAAGTGKAAGDAGAADEGTVLGGADEGAKDAEQEGKADSESDAAAEAQAGPPEAYTLTVPDGFEALDTNILAEATPIFQDLGLTNEQADKLTPIAANLVKKTVERAEKAITDKAIDQRMAWNESFEADAEIGGANKDKTIASAARAFDHYGLKKGEGLRQLLDESGLGNHPDMIRIFAKVGNDLAEGSFDRGHAATLPKAPEAKLYGTEFQPKG